MTGAKKFFRRQAGTTLLELMVTITVFSIFITIGVQLLAVALKNHQQALVKSEILSQTSYALEYISRSLRMAQKDLTGVCIAKNNNFENPNGIASSIRFLNYQKKCMEFLIRDVSKNDKTYTLIMMRRSTNESSGNLGVEVALTAIGPSVSKLSFAIAGQSQGDSIQPGVSLALEFSDSLLAGQKYNIQTSISQRELDVEY